MQAKVVSKKPTLLNSLFLKHRRRDWMVMISNLPKRLNLSDKRLFVSKGLVAFEANWLIDVAKLIGSSICAVSFITGKMLSNRLIIWSVADCSCVTEFIWLMLDVLQVRLFGSPLLITEPPLALFVEQMFMLTLLFGLTLLLLTGTSFTLPISCNVWVMTGVWLTDDAVWSFLFMCNWALLMMVLVSLFGTVWAGVRFGLRLCGRLSVTSVGTVWAWNAEFELE